MTLTINTVGIAGAGTMGVGIANACITKGYTVILFDLDPKDTAMALKRLSADIQKGVEKGKLSREDADKALSRVRIVTEIDNLKADLIIEAIPEKLALKEELFRSLEKYNSDKTILATNTSSIPVTQIGSALRNPSRFLGIHFFNPAHIMKLVEVISGAGTDPEIAQGVKEWITGLGKVPVMVSDSPGFVVNRIARHYYTESLKTVGERSATIQGVDRLLEATGFKMGPFRLMDLIGVDTNYFVTCSMFEQFHMESRFRPSRLQQKYVDAGWHGIKSGKGFYTYEK